MTTFKIDDITINCDDYTDPAGAKVIISDDFAEDLGSKIVQTFDPGDFDVDLIKKELEFFKETHDYTSPCITYECICKSDLNGMFPSAEYIKAKSQVYAEAYDFNGHLFFERVMGDFPSREEFNKAFFDAFFNLARREEFYESWGTDAMWELDNEEERAEREKEKKELEKKLIPSWISVCESSKRKELIDSLADGIYLMVEGATNRGIEQFVYFILKDKLTEAEAERIQEFKGTLEIYKQTVGNKGRIWFGPRD